MTMPQTQKNQQPSRDDSRAKALRGPADAGTENHVYGLVSVLYHALQGAETYEKYIEDAEQAGDEDLVRFFEECRDQEGERAGRAKQLLVERVDEAEGGDKDDEEDEDEI
jgi:hypothetical protein